MNDERSAPKKEVFDSRAVLRKFRAAVSTSFWRRVVSRLLWGRLGLLTDGCSKTYPTIVVAHAGDISVGESKIFSYPADVNPCSCCGRRKIRIWRTAGSARTHRVRCSTGRRKIGSSARAMAAFILWRTGRCWRGRRRGLCQNQTRAARRRSCGCWRHKRLRYGDYGPKFSRCLGSDAGGFCRFCCLLRIWLRAN